MGGNGVCMRLARDGTLERDGLGTEGVISKGTAVSAKGDDNVGEVGNGGTSSVGEEAGGR